MAEENALRRKIAFDRDALDDAIEEQAGLFLQCADAVAMAISRRDEAKSAMDLEFAKACDRARTGAIEKKTESGIKEAAQLDKKHMAAEAAHRDAKLEADLASSLRESFEMRGKMLREMAQLYIAGYYQAAGVGGRIRREINDDAAASARKTLNRSRTAAR